MTPRRTLTTRTALAVGLLLVGGARGTAHADEHAPPPDGDRPPAAETGGDDGAGLWSDPGPRRPGPPEGAMHDPRSAKGEGDGRAERRGGKGGRGGGHGPESVRLTEDQVEDAVALMIELDPAIAPRIEQLRAERPELLRYALSRRFPRLGYMLKLKESRPDLYELRVRDIRLENLSHEQARVLAALPEGDPGADAARAELRATLDEHFTVRQQVRRVEIDALRENLAAMEAKLVDDEGRREALVGERAAQLEAQPPPPADERDEGDPDRRRGRRGDGSRGDEPREDGRRDGGTRGDE